MKLRGSRFLQFTIISVMICGCTAKTPPVIEKKCSACHPSARVSERKRTAAEWDRILFGMKTRGLKVTPEEEKQVRNALAEYYTIK